MFSCHSSGNGDGPQRGAGLGIDADNRRVRQRDDLAHAVDRDRQSARRNRGRALPGPTLVAGGRVKRDDAPAVHVAADLHDHGAAFDQRRHRGAAKQLRRVDDAGVVLAPQQRSVSGAPCGQHAGDAERVDAIARDERRRVRTLGHADGVLILRKRRRILLLPEHLAGLQIDGGDEFLGIAPAVNEDAVAGDDRGRIAFPDLDSPGTASPPRATWRAAVAATAPSRLGPRHCVQSWADACRSARQRSRARGTRLDACAWSDPTTAD